MSRPESRIQPGSGDDGTIRQGPLQGAFDRLRRHVGRQILGQAELVERLLMALLADGHLLVEGAPGLAKTTAIKVLVYDGQGFWLCQKRLSSGRFRWWPVRGCRSEVAKRLAAHQLQVLLSAGNPAGAQGAPDWRPVGPAP